MMQPFILIGNPGNKRTIGLQLARAKLGLAPAHFIAYEDLLAGSTLETCLNSVDLTLMRGAAPILRLDSPGECFPVERSLIALGAPDADESLRDDSLHAYAERSDPQPIASARAKQLAEQRGRIWHPSQWYRGYARLLARLKREALQLWPSSRWMNAPADIAAMFDKRQTHRLLSAAGISVPALLAEPDVITCYEELLDQMRARRMPRIFLKLAYGSGASGIIVYQLNLATGAEIALTTLSADSFASRPPIFYNGSKLHRYTDSQTIRVLVNNILRHGAHIEQWIAKTTLNGRAFDIRQLVVQGVACHSIARVSQTPITNLHLRSERMSPDQAGLPAQAFAKVQTLAENSMSVFNQSSVAGIDVIIRSSDLQPFIVDMNPFGDLLYHALHAGHSTYEWEMLQLKEGPS